MTDSIFVTLCPCDLNVHFKQRCIFVLTTDTIPLCSQPMLYYTFYAQSTVLLYIVLLATDVVLLFVLKSQPTLYYSCNHNRRCTTRVITTDVVLFVLSQLTLVVCNHNGHRTFLINVVVFSLLPKHLSSDGCLYSQINSICF